MFYGSCPDTLANLRPIDLSYPQYHNLLQAWPAAHAAIGQLNLLLESGGLDYEEGDLVDAPLYALVRWYINRDV